MAQVTLNTVNAGKKFNYGGIGWIVLEHQNGMAICLAADVIGDKSFNTNDDIREFNNLAKCTLRKYLNSSFIKRLEKNKASKDSFLEFETDLTTDDGMPNYGVSKDKMSLLTCDQYRKYRRCGVLSVLNKRWWTATAWTASYSYFARHVSSDGTLNFSHACNGYNGVRPLCNLASFLVSV